MATSRLERIGTIFTRKEVIEKALNTLSEAITSFEADYNALKKNKQKLEQITESFFKCLDENATSYQDQLKVMKEIHTNFKKRYDKIDIEQRRQMEKLAGEQENDILNLKQQLVLETKRCEWERLQQYFSNNDVSTIEED